MSLKHRVDQLEERLNLNAERVQAVLFYQIPPDDEEWVPEPFRFGAPGLSLNRVSRDLWAVFSGGTEEQQRAALKRLRQQYQKDPCANRPKPALTGEQDPGSSEPATWLDKREGKA